MAPGCCVCHFYRTPTAELVHLENRPMTNPNTKNPPVLTMPLTVRLDERPFARLLERSRRENVTISFLVRRLISKNDDSSVGA
jgi:hypothetical protein